MKGLSPNSVPRTPSYRMSLHLPILLTLGTMLLTTNTLHAQWEVVGDQQFSNGWARHTVIRIAPDNTPYIAYGDVSLMERVVVERFANDSWQPVGTAGFSAGTSLDISLAISAAGVPYVAYRDMANGQKATVMAYQGGSWGVVGQAGISEGQAMHTCIAIAPDGTPYISYTDGARDNKITTLKYAGGAWAAVGAVGRSPYFASSVSMAFGTDGVLYTGYAGTSGCRVERFTNGAWEQLGVESDFYNARTASLAVGRDGAVYMAYLDGSNDFGGGMRKYVGEAWEQVGPLTFTNTEASMDFYTMALDGNDVPYVAYKDSHAGQKATVQRFVNGAWETVGPVSFTPGTVDFVRLALDQSNVPYVVFSDATEFAYKSTVMRYASGTSGMGETSTESQIDLRYDITQGVVILDEVALGSTYQLMDATGRVLDRGSLMGHTPTLNLSMWPVGHYLLTLEHADRKRVGRLVVVR